MRHPRLFGLKSLWVWSHNQQLDVDVNPVYKSQTGITMVWLERSVRSDAVRFHYATFRIQGLSQLSTEKGSKCNTKLTLHSVVQGEALMLMLMHASGLSVCVCVWGSVRSVRWYVKFCPWFPARHPVTDGCAAGHLPGDGPWTAVCACALVLQWLLHRQGEGGGEVVVGSGSKS